jgi:hypothetical protein
LAAKLAEIIANQTVDLKAYVGQSQGDVDKIIYIS